MRRRIIRVRFGSVSGDRAPADMLGVAVVVRPARDAADVGPMTLGIPVVRMVAAA